MITAKIFLLVAALAPAVFADTRVKLEDLPLPLQKAVNEQAKGATLVGLSTEVEKGKRTYEVQTMVNGKSRDIVLDTAGAVVEVEEQVDLDTVPAPARAALQKKSAGGSIRKVEMVTKGSKVSYEAAITTKAGKKIETAVNPDGSVHKD